MSSSTHVPLSHTRFGGWRDRIASFGYWRAAIGRLPLSRQLPRPLHPCRRQNNHAPGRRRKLFRPTYDKLMLRAAELANLNLTAAIGRSDVLAVCDLSRFGCVNGSRGGAGRGGASRRGRPGRRPAGSPAMFAGDHVEPKRGPDTDGTRVPLRPVML